MKKIILSLALLASATVAANAQGVSFGAKVGASLTNFTGDNLSGNKNKFGVNAGVLANFGINDMFSVQPELLYSQKGAGADGSDTKLRLNYIDVPVMVKVNAGGLFFEAGPQVGFLAGAKVVNGSNSVDVKSEFASVDFGYAAGLGYAVENGPMIGLRYNGGITDINKNSTANDKQRNSAFQLYVGYMFGGK